MLIVAISLPGGKYNTPSNCALTIEHPSYTVSIRCF